MTNSYYVKDENLGGIERKFEPADRNADAGDYVINISDNAGVPAGEIHRITDISDNKLHEDYDHGREFIDSIGGKRCYWRREGKYITLEPTEIVRVNGKDYLLVERTANIGDTVLIVESEECADINGKVGVVVRKPFENTAFNFENDFEIATPSKVYGNEGTYVDHITDEYYVLEPLESGEQGTPCPRELTADERITWLEDKVAELEELIDANRKDLRTWTEDYEQNKHDVSLGLAELDDEVNEFLTEVASTLLRRYAK